jgi:hypothetical protein
MSMAILIVLLFTSMVCAFVLFMLCRVRSIPALHNPCHLAGRPRNIAGLELFIGGRKRALKWPASHRPL